MSASEGNKPGIYGLLGYGIKYSLSPEIHNHIFSRFGITAIYGLFDVPPGGFRAGIRALAEKASGFNVTKPYKEETAKIFTSLSREARLTGSVSMVSNNMGYNTDYLALEELVHRHGNGLAGMGCTIFGSGGAARTAAFLFGKLKMQITIMNRSIERAQKLEMDLASAGIEANAVPLTTLSNSGAMESAVFVNSISHPGFGYPGMKAKLAVDFNYASRSGDFRSKLLGKPPIISGEEILALQAIHSQRIWNKIDPDFNEIMEVINVQHTG